MYKLSVWWDAQKITAQKLTARTKRFFRANERNPAAQTARGKTDLEICPRRRANDRANDLGRLRQLDFAALASLASCALRRQPQFGPASTASTPTSQRFTRVGPRRHRRRLCRVPRPAGQGRATDLLTCNVPPAVVAAGAGALASGLAGSAWRRLLMRSQSYSLLRVSAAPSAAAFRITLRTLEARPDPSSSDAAPERFGTGPR